MLVLEVICGHSVNFKVNHAVGERIIKVKVISVGRRSVKLGFEAPLSVDIQRNNAKKKAPRLVEVEEETEGQLAMRADHTRTINGIYDSKPAEQWGRRPKRA